MTETVQTSDRIRTILSTHGHLNTDARTLDADADLYEAGMTSFASVNIMLALELEFEVEFPDNMLSRSVFGSISDIEAAIESLSQV